MHGHNIKALRDALNPLLTVKKKVLLQDLRIRTKDRELVPFKPNVPQAKYIELLGGVEIRGKRELLLKARQEGFTTLIAALFFLDTINNRLTNSVIIADDKESTERIFQIIRRYYDNLPDDKKPRTKYENKGELSFPELDSTFYVGTAGSRNYGRGTTVNNVHASEVAFWQNPEDIITGLLQAVPEDGNIFLESTANGMGNYFHLEWNNPESIFAKRFFPWYEHTDYQVAVTDEVITEDEQPLVEAYNLSLPQLLWRRKKVKELKEKFKQEYPSNPKEAFIASGNNFFDAEVLDAYITSTPGNNKPIGYIEFLKPQKNSRYIIGADTSEGLDGEGDHDFSAFQVLDVDTWEQVARFKGRLEPVDFARELVKVGAYYNNALIVVERNNHGHAVLAEMIHHSDYPRMARDKWGGIYYHLDYDASRRARIRKPGYPTNVKTKMIALDSLAASLLDGDILFNDADTLGEMTTYQKLPGNKLGAMPGCHDDLVIAMALAVCIAKDRPKVRSKAKPVRKRGAFL